MFNSAKQACQSSTSLRRMGLIALTACAIVITNAGAWFPSQTHAFAAASTNAQIDPFQIMTDHTNLPTQQVADLSVIFD